MVIVHASHRVAAGQLGHERDEALERGISLQVGDGGSCRGGEGRWRALNQLDRDLDERGHDRTMTRRSAYGSWPPSKIGAAQ